MDRNHHFQGAFGWQPCLVHLKGSEHGNKGKITSNRAFGAHFKFGQKHWQYDRSQIQPSHINPFRADSQARGDVIRRPVHCNRVHVPRSPDEK